MRRRGFGAFWPRWAVLPGLGGHFRGSLCMHWGEGGTGLLLKGFHETSTLWDQLQSLPGELPPGPSRNWQRGAGLWVRKQQSPRGDESPAGTLLSQHQPKGDSPPFPARSLPQKLVPTLASSLLSQAQGDSAGRQLGRKRVGSSGNPLPGSSPPPEQAQQCHLDLTILPARTHGGWVVTAGL